MDSESQTPESSNQELLEGQFNRDHIARVWMMYHQGIAPRGNDRILLQVLTMHPEYYDAWDTATAGTRQEEIVIDGVNPYLHAYFHAVIENQIETREPPEVAETYKALLDAHVDLHEVIHRISAPLAEQVWAMLHDHVPFDEKRYVRDLAKLRRSVQRSRRKRDTG